LRLLLRFAAAAVFGSSFPACHSFSLMEQSCF
jgi:hypothetical protein